MSNVNVGRRSDGKITGPVDSGTVIDKGDFVYWDTDDLKNAGAQADQGSEVANQRLLASKFAGIAELASASGDTDDILVDANPLREFELTCASSTYEVGDLLGVDENGTGDALLDQTVAKVTDPQAAIAVVTKREASATTTVRARLIAGTNFNLLNRVYANVQTAAACIPVPLGCVTQEDGTALLKQATTVAGYSQLANKETVILIPVNCSAGESLGFSVGLPRDLDTTQDIIIDVLASKDADNDVLTLDAEAYINGAGDLANADGQDTAAQTIVAAGTVLSFTIGADANLTAPAALSVVLALGGTNDGDAVYIYGIWIRYTRKVLTA